MRPPLSLISGRRLVVGLLLVVPLLSGAIGLPSLSLSPSPSTVRPSRLPTLGPIVENGWVAGAFTKMNWGPEGGHAFAWSPANVSVLPDGSVQLKQTASGQAGIQSGSTFDGGRIEYDVTYPSKVASGMDVGSGYLYAANGDEIDFPEVLRDCRPRLAVHQGGLNVGRLLPMKVCGQRHLWAVSWRAGEFIRFYMDDRLVWTVRRNSLPANMSLPVAPMKWISNISLLTASSDWAGPYKPPAPLEEWRYFLHGWRYTAMARP